MSEQLGKKRDVDVLGQRCGNGCLAEQEESIRCITGRSIGQLELEKERTMVNRKQLNAITDDEVKKHVEHGGEVGPIALILGDGSSQIGVK